jgi:uncharacterized protein (TIGR02996 family)
MNEEDAFVQNIVANPQDAKLKLVYADWLEERGDSRSKYLRLDVEFSQISEQEPRYAEFREQLHAFQQSTDAAWRQQVGFRYDAILERYSPEYKEHVIKQVRQAAGLDLFNALRLVNRVPTAIKKGVSREDAERIKDIVETPTVVGFAAIGIPEVTDQRESRVRIQLSAKG